MATGDIKSMEILEVGPLVVRGYTSKKGADYVVHEHFAKARVDGVELSNIPVECQFKKDRSEYGPDQIPYAGWLGKVEERSGFKGQVKYNLNPWPFGTDKPLNQNDNKNGEPYVAQAPTGAPGGASEASQGGQGGTPTGQGGKAPTGTVEDALEAGEKHSAFRKKVYAKVQEVAIGAGVEDRLDLSKAFNGASIRISDGHVSFDEHFGQLELFAMKVKGEELMGGAETPDIMAEFATFTIGMDKKGRRIATMEDYREANKPTEDELAMDQGTSAQEEADNSDLPF